MGGHCPSWQPHIVIVRTCKTAIFWFVESAEARRPPLFHITTLRPDILRWVVLEMSKKCPQSISEQKGGGTSCVGPPYNLSFPDNPLPGQQAGGVHHYYCSWSIWYKIYFGKSSSFILLFTLNSVGVGHPFCAFVARYPSQTTRGNEARKSSHLSFRAQSSMQSKYIPNLLQNCPNWWQVRQPYLYAVCNPA